MSKFGGGIGAPSKEERLIEAANIHLRLGQIQRYCELMVELGQVWSECGYACRCFSSICAITSDPSKPDTGDTQLFLYFIFNRMLFNSCLAPHLSLCFFFCQWKFKFVGLKANPSKVLQLLLMISVLSFNLSHHQILLKNLQVKTVGKRSSKEMACRHKHSGSPNEGKVKAGGQLQAAAAEIDRDRGVTFWHHQDILINQSILIFQLLYLVTNPGMPLHLL